MTQELGDTVKEIELTDEGKKPIKNIDFVTGMDRISALHDPVRIQILQMLREGIDDSVTTERADDDALVLTITTTQVKRYALSVTELIQRAKTREEYDILTKNQLYHHLPILIEHGFVCEYGTVTKGKRTTKYYRRTADRFVTFGLHYGPKKFRQAIRKEIVDALPVFRIRMTDSEREKLVDLLVETEAMRVKWASALENIVQGDVTDPKGIEMIEWFLWVYATGQPEYQDLLNKLRKSLFP